MAKLVKPKEETISIGALTCTIEYNSTFSDVNTTMIKSKIILAMTEALANVR